MPRKPRLYLENSAICMYFQDDAPYLRDLTRQFWREILPNFDIYISEAVLDEIRATEELNLRKALENLIKDFEVLEITEEVIELSIVKDIKKGANEVKKEMKTLALE